MASCAAFRKESRMKFANATKLDRKSGVAQWSDLRFVLAPTATDAGGARYATVRFNWPQAA